MHAVEKILAKAAGREEVTTGEIVNCNVDLAGIANLVTRGEVLSADLALGEVINQTTGATAAAQPLSAYVMAILENGGVKPMIRKQRELLVEG